MHKDCSQTINYSIFVPKNMISWIQDAVIFRHRTSDVNRLRHWRMHVQNPMSVQGYSVGCIQYVTVCVRHYHNYAQSLHQALPFTTKCQERKRFGVSVFLVALTRSVFQLVSMQLSDIWGLHALGIEADAIAFRLMS